MQGLGAVQSSQIDEFLIILLSPRVLQEREVCYLNVTDGKGQKRPPRDIVRLQLTVPLQIRSKALMHGNP